MATGDMPFTVSPELSAKVVDYLQNITDKTTFPMTDYRDMMQKIDS